MPKKIDPALKERAVRLVLEHRAEYPTLTAAVQAVARQVGSVRIVCGVGSLRPRSTPVSVRVSTSESAEIRRLKAENRRLREDNEILKAASIFFAGELDPRNR